MASSSTPQYRLTHWLNVHAEDDDDDIVEDEDNVVPITETPPLKVNRDIALHV